MMAKDIQAGRAYVELMLKDKNFQQRLAAAGKKLVAFGKTAALAGAAVGAAALTGVTVAVRQFTKLGDELDKMSQRTGVSVEALSELKYAAEQSGSSISEIEGSIRGVQKALTAAKMGSQGAAQGFRMLGLSVNQLGRMSPEEQYMAVVQSLSRVTDATVRARIATNALGSANLIPMIDSVETLRKEAREMGLTVSTGAAQSAARLGGMFTTIGSQVKTTFFELGGVFAPLLEEVLPVVSRFGAQVIDPIRIAGDFMRENTKQVTDFLIAAWQGYFDYMAPIAGAYQAMWSTAFETVYSVVTEVWSSIESTTTGLMESMTGVVGSGLAWFQDAWINALSTISFAFENWRTVIDTVVTSAQLSIVRFGNQTTHLFSEVIPKCLAWFSENWYGVFTDVANITATITQNIWKNLVSLWDGIVGLFSGEGFNFEWTPLTKGFESAIKSLPQIAEREMGPLEKQLQERINGIADELVSKYEAHHDQFKAKVDSFTPKNPFATPDTPAGKRPALAGAGGVRDFDALGTAADKRTFATFSAVAAAAAGQGGSVDRSAEKQLAATNKTNDLLNTIRRQLHEPDRLS